MSINSKRICAGTIAAAVLALGASSAMADTPWQQQHPWREQVNNRLQRQNARIHQQVAEGELSKSQAAALHRRDRSIRAQERRMAARNDGHLTKGQQRLLNRRENHVSRRIGR